MGLGSLHLTSHAPVTKFKISVMDLFVRFSPPSALYQRQQGGLDWLSRPLVLYPTNDIEISDAQVHQRGTGGRQYVVFGFDDEANMLHESKQTVESGGEVAAGRDMLVWT